ncbi:MAG TPA: hypothetical protein VFY68_05695 [Nitrososphaeraceae archaeon]|nr:hypothetical protein [Nitrososphaeraceae archaeon]
MNGDKKEDWCIISLDGTIIRARIIHKSRGKYKIVEDTKNGIYVDKTVDASDIIQVEK